MNVKEGGVVGFSAAIVYCVQVYLFHFLLVWIFAKIEEFSSRSRLKSW